MPQCSLCLEGPISWAMTEKSDKRVPINSRPNPNGTAWWVNTEKGRRLRVASKEHPKPDDGTPLYRLHFLDCKVHAAKKRLEAQFK